MTTLGRLEKVELRDIWANEAGDFTPWLAQEDNIVLLGDTIDLELEVEAQEESVGPFRADILCKDTANNNWVLIENQLERTDHTHMGQLITYAAGLDAVTIVWVAQRFTEEHRAALDWLNEKTDEAVNFFGLEIELWKIGDSAMAPKFNIVSKPNDWSRTIKKTTTTGEVTDKGKLRLEFWAGWHSYLSLSKIKLKPSKPNSGSYMNYGIGKTSVYLSSSFLFRSYEKQSCELGEIRAELVISSKEHAGTYYRQLYAQKESIENQLGFKLECYEKKGQTARGAAVRSTVDVYNKAKWPEYYQWLKDHLEKMHTVLSPIAKQLDTTEMDEIGDRE